MYACVSTQPHIHTLLCIHVDFHTRMYTCFYVYRWIYTPTCTHSSMYIFGFIHPHIHTLLFISVDLYTHMYARFYVYMCTWHYPLKLKHSRDPPDRGTQIYRCLAVQIQIEILVAPSGQVLMYAEQNLGVYLSGGLSIREFGWQGFGP